MGGYGVDIRRAVRALTKRPVYAATVVLTLAIGVGATSAVFSLINGILLDPLPYPDSDEIVNLWFEVPTGPGKVRQSIGTYLVFRDQLRALEDVALAQPRTVTLRDGGDVERLEASQVTHSVFPLLRSTVAAGRPLLEDDEAPGAEPVVVLSDAFWDTRYGRDPAVVGTMLEVDGVQRRVVGMLPRGLRFPAETTQLWIPYTIDPTAPGNNNAFIHPGYARLADSQTLETATADLLGVTRKLPEAYPASFPQQLIDRLGVLVSPLKAEIIGETASILWVVFGSVGIVLLIAVANVANLVLIRTEARAKEVALHRALGSRVQRVVAGTLIESVMLGLAGGGAGLVAAVFGLAGLRRLAPDALPRMAEVGLDPTTVAFTSAVALIAGLCFGAVPALRAAKVPPGSLLRSTRGATGSSRGTTTLRAALVVGQIALALVTLVGAGLLLRSFSALRGTDPGFRAENVIGMRTALPAPSYPDDASRRQLFQNWVDRVRNLPGVESAALSNYLPLRDGRIFQIWDVEEFPREPNQLPVSTLTKVVSEDYFETMHIERIAGRTFRRDDADPASPWAAVVNEAYAALYWPETSPLGKRIRIRAEDRWFEIVGVVESVRDRQLAQPPQPIVYTGMLDRAPTGIYAWSDMSLAVKAAPDADVIPAVRNELRALDPGVPLFDVRSMDAVLSAAAADTRFTFVLLTVAAGAALLLGAVGLYGVLAYLVGARTREIGVRMALGAERKSVRRMVERQALTLVAAGALLGYAASFLTRNLLASVLYGVAPGEPVTLALVTAVLATVGWTAAAVPAWRAARIDPVEALRGEE